MERPLITIITVVYNAYSTLELAIKSVLNQDKKLFEYIIIDGGSTDGSLEIIQKYKDKLAAWSSEPDNGIYDAMNKGIDNAKGQWIYFLGADDLLTQDALVNISTHLIPTLSVVYGDVIYDTGHRFKSSLGFRTLLENTLHHQSAFYNKNIFNSFLYNCTYKVNADYELNLILFLQREEYKYVSLTVAICGSKGISSALASEETNNIRKMHITSPVLNYTLSTLLNIYYSLFKFKNYVKRISLISK